MISGKQIFFVYVIFILMIFCVLNNTFAHPMHIGGGDHHHHGGSGIGNILAAGIILSLLQQHG